MTDPCDSSRSAGAGVWAAGRGSSCLTIEAQTHAGEWSWLEPMSTAVEPTCAAVAAAIEGGAERAADLALSNDAGVRALNRDWRGQDQPTNVLSFPAPKLHGGHDGVRFLGDIVMAEETLLAEAAAAGIPPRHHFQHLLVHALLHLMGHDHADEREAAAMETLETRILQALGVPDPYAGTEPVTARG